MTLNSKGTHQKHKWENAMTILKESWGVTRDSVLRDYHTIEYLIKELASTVSCGGNLLMNIGPRSDGTIPVILQERLKQMGDWLKVNGEAIYGSKPWKAQNDSYNPSTWYTQKEGFVYAILLEWPKSDKLVLSAPIPTGNTEVTMLGMNQTFTWGLHSPLDTNTSSDASMDGQLSKMSIYLPPIAISELPSLWAWVLRFTNVT